MESSTDRLRLAPDDQSLTGESDDAAQNEERPRLPEVFAHSDLRRSRTTHTRDQTSESAVMPKSTRTRAETDSGTQHPAVKITPAVDCSGPVTTTRTTR